MPIITSSYKAPLLFKNPHFSTLYASVLRKVDGVKYTRERLELSDGDFVDLDWSFGHIQQLNNLPENKASKNLVIITHGFLGNSNRQYVKGTVKIFNQMGWDALAWNHRGLSGEPNRFEKLTTHGSTDELAEIIDHVLKLKKYQNIVLVGWSKGGNICTKYAGEKGGEIAPEIKAVAGVSMPTDIYSSVQVMGKNSFYANRFRDKTFNFLRKRKHLIDPEKFSEFSKYKILDDFTEWYIGPLHGYKNAKDYYVKCSAIDYLPNIKVPTLILNAIDDPILSLTCSPFQLAKNSEIIHLENPKHGGHCGFYESNNNGIFWAEKRVFEFVSGFCG
jgi:uncharacterized protein